MATETMNGPHRTATIFRRFTTGAVAGGATFVSQARATGLSRVVGNVHMDVPAAAGFPIVEQSTDGTNFSIAETIARDASQSGYQYPIDVKIKLPYVRFRHTVGSSAATFHRTWVQLSPQAGDPSVRIAGGGGTTLVESAVATQFTAAVTRNNSETETLTGLPSSAVLIKRVTLLTTERLDWFLGFYGASTFVSGAGIGTNTYLGGVFLPATLGVQIADQPAAANHYCYDVLVEIPYVDSAASNSLYVALSPRSGNKTATAAYLKVFMDPVLGS